MVAVAICHVGRLMEGNDPQRVDALKAQAPLAESSPERLDSSSSMEGSIASMLRHQVRNMVSHESGLLAGSNGEDLHELRVLSRRLRELFSIDGVYGQKKDTKRLRKGLQHLGQVLGAVRDLDILIESTEAYAASRSRTDLSDFIGALRSEHEVRREKAKKYIMGSDYSRLKESIELLAGRAKKSAEHYPDSGEAVVRPSSVSTILPSVLLARYGYLRAYDGWLDSSGPLRVDRFHRLRIEAKRLRYLIEFFQDYLGPECKPLIQRIKQVQDLLGRMQDAQTACCLIRQYLEVGNLRGKATSGKYEALATQSSLIKYLAARQSELRTCVRRFPSVWRLVSSRWFALRLANLVGRL